MEVLSTYRVQLHAGFTFQDAAEIVPYLRDLGISHLYCSPYLQAAKGSTHGYDVVDHHRVNQELGGGEGHQLLAKVLRHHGLGQVLDVVPNHMAIPGNQNAWWYDVLENGRASRYASYFDVDWAPPEERLRNKVLVPVLGDHYGRVLESGEIRLAREGGSFSIRYHDHVLPVAPDSLDALLLYAGQRADSDYLIFAAGASGRLPHSLLTDRASILRRHRDKEVLRDVIRRVAENPEIGGALDDAVAAVNASADALDALLERQNYRLSYWRTADRELGYRRFFDVNTLVGLNMEKEHVFEDTHQLVLEWLQEGLLDGIRIDHPDGLQDPQEYFERLNRAAPEAWVVAEKILMPGEHLRESWPIAGTTGYDFLNLVGGLFVDPAGEAPLTALYQELTSDQNTFADIVPAKKQQLLREGLASDVNRLTADFMRICERHRAYRDFTRHEVHHALREIIARFPVYRTYVVPERGEADEDDVRYVEEAARAAKANRPDLDARLFEFIRAVLLLEIQGDVEDDFVLRFQQFTGPAQAKGVEDTALYNYPRLIALNEVGGDPGCFGVSVEEFHRACEETQRIWPRTMLTTSTHDTKFSEDVRARVALLSEIPGEWRAFANRWFPAHEGFKEGAMPDRTTQYLLYQALVGAWPISAERIKTYTLKAAREAKKFTSWTDPDPQYEKALETFVARVLADQEFVRDLESFLQPLMEPWWTTSLAQTLIKLTAPGVPDLYQGTELWQLSLVDPDNRRPADYALRRRLLDVVCSLDASAIWARAAEGLPKLWVIRQALQLRRRRPDLYSASSYEPLYASGPRNGHAVAFIRGGAAISVAPRLAVALKNGWHGTTLTIPEGRWEDAFTHRSLPGGPIELEEVLHPLPVALLVRA